MLRHIVAILVLLAACGSSATVGADDLCPGAGVAVVFAGEVEVPPQGPGFAPMATPVNPFKIFSLLPVETFHPPGSPPGSVAYGPPAVRVDWGPWLTGWQIAVTGMPGPFPPPVRVTVVLCEMP